MLIYLEIFTVINVLAITLNFTVMCVTRENKKTILINTLINVFVTAILMGISCLLFSTEIEKFFNWFFADTSVDNSNGYYFILGLMYLFMFGVCKKMLGPFITGCCYRLIQKVKSLKKKK